MEWVSLTESGQIETIKDLSKYTVVLIFKHSSRCSLSAVALQRLESNWGFYPEQVQTYIVNVISHRGLSQKVAADFGVRHESPQVLLIRNGKCVEHTSHLSITYSSVVEAIGN